MTQKEGSRKKLIDILAEVSQETGVAVLDITGPEKRALFVKARSLFARRAYAEEYTYRDIGEALGRAHTTALYYLGKAEKKIKEASEDMKPEELDKAVDSLTKEETKELVKRIAKKGTKEDRDNLAALFSGVEGERVAPVETAPTGGEPRAETPRQEKKKEAFDPLDF